MRRPATIDLDPLGGPGPLAEDPLAARLFGDPDVEREEQAPPSRHEKMLTSIRRAAELARRETGVHALWFGWPLLHVSTSEDNDARKVPRLGRLARTEPVVVTEVPPAGGGFEPSRRGVPPRQ